MHTITKACRHRSLYGNLFPKHCKSIPTTASQHLHRQKHFSRQISLFPAKRSFYSDPPSLQEQESNISDTGTRRGEYVTYEPSSALLVESLLSEVFLRPQGEESEEKEEEVKAATRFQDPNINYALTYRLFRAMARMDHWIVPCYDLGDDGSALEGLTRFDGDTTVRNGIIDTMVTLNADESMAGEYGLASVEHGGDFNKGENKNVSILVFTRDRIYKSAMKRVMLPITVIGNGHVRGLVENHLDDLSQLTKLAPPEESDSGNDDHDKDTKPGLRGRQVHEIIVNFGTAHAFHIKGFYFQALSHWKGIIQVEQALHELRPILESMNSIIEQKEELVDQGEEGDIKIPIGEQDRDLIRKSSAVVNSFEKYFVFMKKTVGSKKLQLFFVPNEEDKRYVALFTAPDMAYRFAEKYDIDQSMMRTISGGALFKKLNKKYNSNQKSVDGVMFNVLNTDHDAPNRELTLPSSLLSVLVSN